MLTAMLAAFMGGIILNFMPCVFPIISLKALALIRNQQHPAETRREGLAFLLGTLVTMMVLAGILLAARAGGATVGWGFQLQSPLVIASLALIMLCAALNLLGVYEVGLSAQRAGEITPTGNSAFLRAALTGALSIIVATPCAAPFMAGAIGYALVQPPAVAMIVFFTLALGFAAPFALVSFFPVLGKAMTDHKALIAQLSRTVQPVKRPWRSGWRALSWVAISLPCGAAASLILQRTLTDWSQPGSSWVILQLLLTLITGVLAVHNAFQMSIAGRKHLSWKWFAPLILLWLATTLTNVQHSTSPIEFIEGTHCYLFMVVVSTPMMVIAITYIHRTRAVYPIRTLATAGAGVACMALTLLSLCHPTHISIQDLSMHTAATITIILVTIFTGYRWVSLRHD